jgi:hypothetical protein
MASIKNSFTKGPEGWCSYEYHASMVAKQNIFVLTTWASSGGVKNAAYVWADETRWSADTPETPLSILPFIHYRSWVGEDPVDLRGGQLAVYLRGDDLLLNGAQCYFWAHVGGTRWHCNQYPIEISDGCWATAASVVPLNSDESSWYMSWTRDPDSGASLDTVLGAAESYGFSFVGFSGEVCGRLSMSGFEISLP